MVVARKRRPQTTQRMVDFGGALVVKPESARLVALIDISCNSSLNIGVTYVPDYFGEADSGQGASRMRIVCAGQ